MNRRTLRILLEAVAITICLLVIVEQQSEAGITSKATAWQYDSMAWTNAHRVLWESCL